MYSEISQVSHIFSCYISSILTIRITIFLQCRKLSKHTLVINDNSGDFLTSQLYLISLNLFLSPCFVACKKVIKLYCLLEFYNYYYYNIWSLKVVYFSDGITHGSFLSGLLGLNGFFSSSLFLFFILLCFTHLYRSLIYILNSFLTILAFFLLWLLVLSKHNFSYGSLMLLKHKSPQLPRKCYLTMAQFT